VYGYIDTNRRSASANGKIVRTAEEDEMEPKGLLADFDTEDGRRGG
jgi:hypothetical protein